MARMGKYLASCSVVILAFSMSIIILVDAQSIYKPSVPEFTAKLISSSPESQSVNSTIELSIKNQPSISFYSVRMRVNDGNWILLYPNNNSVPAQSNGEFTVLSYPPGALGVEYQYFLGYITQNLSAGDKVDFQVQSMVGSIHRVYNPNFTCQLDMYPYVFAGETSDWSLTQTIVVTAGSSSVIASPSLPSVAPTSPDSIHDLTLLLALVAFSVLVFTAILLLYFNQLKRRLSEKQF